MQNFKIIIYCFVRKRLAARELITQYYHQLTEGCGNAACSNENCASSSTFRFKEIDKNNLAVEAIELSKAKATLCERRPGKIPRLPAETDNASATTLSITPGEPVGLGAKSKMPSPTASYVDESFLPSSSSSNSSLGKLFP